MRESHHDAGTSRSLDGVLGQLHWGKRLKQLIGVLTHLGGDVEHPAGQRFAEGGLE